MVCIHKYTHYLCLYIYEYTHIKTMLIGRVFLPELCVAHVDTRILASSSTYAHPENRSRPAVTVLVTMPHYMINCNTKRSMWRVVSGHN